ncbi:hypothetical protein Poli38472_011011 [Pythium oligandrum]|uniref:EF-hand domain-containing protein n=1 Tax=Pythium oligandrum TaxID=41045 RepID=A0A8K1CRL3_PYTOL|nr:hypothetical protein Poli38472_011011 [Pythium oligandrum]|eukprot:TMW67391.1 hypothetical protein Poli38472_011011 [Pythium oligandrum]
MQKPSVRGFSLRGATFGTKVRVRKKKPHGSSVSVKRVDTAKEDVSNIAPIVTIDILIGDLRKKLHTIFCNADPTIAVTNLYENCSHQAFRYFTTTNTITPEAFHHRVNKLGLQASRELCLALFHLVDQEDLGELTYAAFARRIFLPAGYFNFSKPITPTADSPTANDDARETPRSARTLGDRPSSASSRDSSIRTPPIRHAVATSVSPNASSPSGNSTPRRSVLGDGHVALIYETMTLQEIEQCISRKLEERTSRTTDRFRQAFRFFTKSEGITFHDFHHQLELLQIHLSTEKCRDLFNRFDLDKNGTIELSEFTSALFQHEENEANLLRSASRLGSEVAGPPCRLEDFEVEAGSSLSIQQILSKLREKLEQHTSKETDRFRQAFKIFSKSTGITPPEFNTAMTKLGLKLTERQLQELFELFDFDHSGDLDLNEFVQGVMLDDASTKVWHTIKDRQKVEESRRKLYSMAVQSVQSGWTIAEIEQMLREKIEQRTSRSSDCFRQAFRIFKKVNGIKPEEFHAALESIGLTLDRSQADVLFERFDTDGSGEIDLDEFIHGVLPPDYTGHQWVAAADELHRQAAQKKKVEAMLRPDRFMTDVEMENWSLDEIEKRIRDKIQQSTSKSSDTFRQAYKIFKKSNHVTIDEFRERLLALGFRLTPAQCLGLFRRYDSNNSNDIDLQEFCLRILPPDYTGDGDHWSHSDKYHKKKESERLEYVKRSKNGLLTLPKFDEARVRYTRGQYIDRTFNDLRDDDVSLHIGDVNEKEEDAGMRPASPVTPRSGKPQRPETPRRPQPPTPQRPTSASSSQASTQTVSAPSTPKSPRAPEGERPMSPRTTRLEDRSPRIEIGPDARALRRATPPTSPRRVTTNAEAYSPMPHRPLSPRAMLSGSRSLSRVASPRSPRSPMVSPRDNEYIFEDDEILEDCDNASERLSVHSMRILRAKRFEAAMRRRRHGDNESVGADSTTSFSSTVQRAVGIAKYTPARSNVLLMQRFMRVAGGKGGGDRPHTARRIVDMAHRGKSKRQSHRS